MPDHIPRHTHCFCVGVTRGSIPGGGVNFSRCCICDVAKEEPWRSFDAWVDERKRRIKKSGGKK